jgi:hypothetical protein
VVSYNPWYAKIGIPARGRLIGAEPENRQVDWSENKKAALPVMMEARPSGAKATGQSGRVRTRSGWPHELAFGSLDGQWSAPHQGSAVEKGVELRSHVAQRLDVQKRVRLASSLVAALLNAFLSKLTDKIIVLASLKPSTYLEPYASGFPLLRPCIPPF